MPNIHSSPKQLPQGTPTESIKSVKQVKPEKPPKPAVTVKRLGLQDTLKLCVKYFWYGVKDAFAWPSSLIIIYMSSTIRNRALKCFTLNGIIFLGSIALFNNFTLPILHFFLGNEGAEEGGREGGEKSLFVAIILGWLVKLTYLLFWIYPVFLLSFVLNAMWYQQIADRAYRIKYGQPSNQQLTYSRLPKVVADEIYRALLLMNYLIVATLVYVIPIIGPALSFMFICWIYAFYSFEYKWTAKRWNLEQRIDYFEERWAYFAGFGIYADFKCN
ncbi:650_t:CDS:2 [Paraglomus occultum]|uniref:650_t:CDS:1 n=1 Tax=Paraglomus occultum TaxID=144539 RepID=A0A9N8YYQ5_9GLOM|nr:650_t:CDS:2 [Paraglomus occultum]